MKCSKKSILICVISLSTASILIGWKIKPVELVDNKLLIDLDSVIHESSWGQEGFPDNISTNETSEEPKEKDIDSKIPHDIDLSNMEMNALSISIQGEKIILDDLEIKDVETLKNILSQKIDKTVSISLEDDYAESHLYKKVYQMIEQLQSENIFEFNEIVR